MLKQILLASALALGATGAAQADAMSCVVNDPTGTPLNLRAAPGGGGSIIGALHNGAPVVATDARGAWWFITPLGAGKSGWAYSPYLSNCHLLT